ncbi:kinase-like domain-containing protein [Penicillium lividum]|nr:kinase-like domain-containing protein [Penicillium lividum]
MLSGWGWISPEREGRSPSESSLSGQDSTTVGPDQTLGTATSNHEAKAALHKSFTDNYGKFSKVLNYDNSNTVQLYERKTPVAQIQSPGKSPSSPMMMRIRRASGINTIKELYAIKVFHHAESITPFLANNQSRSLLLRHPNIISIIGILYNEQKNICLVMPYYTGGTLHSFLFLRGPRGKVSDEELNCWAIQILRAVAYLHDNNIAHGDLRPEHIFLTAAGAVKVGGFGEDVDAVRELADLLHDHPTSPLPDSKPRRYSALASDYKPKLCIRKGLTELSVPYLPPERFFSRRGFSRQNYPPGEGTDIRAGDVWACGMLYMTMLTGQLLWRSAQADSHDKNYANYLNCRMTYDGYGPIQALGTRCRNVIYAMLHPDWGSRITAAEVLMSEWALGVAVCEIGETG